MTAAQRKVTSFLRRRGNILAAVAFRRAVLAPVTGVVAVAVATAVVVVVVVVAVARDRGRVTTDGRSWRHYCVRFCVEMRRMEHASDGGGD